MVVIAGSLAALSSVVPRVLSGPAEHPPPVPAPISAPVGKLRPELVMGLQGSDRRTLHYRAERDDWAH